jgi:sugar transferase EpsL
MLKRLFDLVVSCSLLLLALPIMAVLALLVRRNLGSPVIFSQVRPGLYGTPFRVYKFRTMNDMRDANGQLMPDDVRLTKFGRLLRSSSLDELPQLFNVVKGDISLVGPRPLLMDYLPLYSADQMRRHEVRPGVTGWAQVNGRNAINWDQKFAFDLWYVDHCSLWLDLKILFLTAKKVLAKEGIAAPGTDTMPRFLGSGKDMK